MHVLSKLKAQMQILTQWLATLLDSCCEAKWYPLWSPTYSFNVNGLWFISATYMLFYGQFLVCNAKIIELTLQKKTGLLQCLWITYRQPFTSCIFSWRHLKNKNKKTCIMHSLDFNKKNCKPSYIVFGLRTVSKWTGSF